MTDETAASSAGGTGAAYDATVITSHDIGELEEALKQARREWEAGAVPRRVAAAQASVDKAEAQLAAAEEALANTIVEEEERAAEDEAGRAVVAARLAARAAAEAEGN